MSRSRTILVVLVFGTAISLAIASEETQPTDADEALLKQAGINTDGDALLAFFQKHGPRPALAYGELVEQLGDPRFTARDKAMNALIAAGRAALPKLREILKVGDLETIRRAEQCIRAIHNSERSAPPEVHAAAARLLVSRRPVAATEALLAYLPAVSAGEAEEATWLALEALAQKRGALEPSLAGALQDASPNRRSVAACLAARFGNATQKAAVRKLLEDPVPLVRLRVAQGLLASADASGLPTLIALLEEPSIDTAWQAEELLHWVAGVESPVETVGSGIAEDRRACRAAWQGWYKKRGAQVDLTRLLREPRRPGLFLVVEKMYMPGPPGTNGQDYYGQDVCLYGHDSSIRWQLKDLPEIRDLHWLPEGRLLLVEGQKLVRGGTPQGKAAVTERDVMGKVDWRHESTDWSLLGCRRHADGITALQFVDGFQEIAYDGATFFSHRLVGGSPHVASGATYGAVGMKRLVNGNLVYQRVGSEMVEVQPHDGKVVRKTSLEALIDRKTYHSSDGPREAGHFAVQGVSLLADGHFAVIDRWGGQVFEAGPTGKTLRRYAVEDVWDVARSQKGRLVVGCGQHIGRIAEFDTAGRVCWEAFTSEAYKVRPCLGLLRVGFPDPDFTNGDVASYAGRHLGLRSNSPVVRGRTALALSKLGQAALPAVPAIAGLLADPDSHLSYLGASALQNLGLMTVPALVDALRDESPKKRARAADILAWLGPNARVAAPELVANLQNSDEYMRQEAARALRRIAPDPGVEEQRLLELLSHSQWQVRGWAFDALQKTAPHSPRAFEALLSACRSKDDEASCQAIEALAATGIRENRVVQALLHALENDKTRCTAIVAIAELGPEAQTAVPALVSLLSEVDQNRLLNGRQTRECILKTLGKLGPHARGALPYLKEALQRAEPGSTKRLEVLRALAGMGQPAATILLPYLEPRQANSSEQWVILSALRPKREDGPWLVPALLELFKSKKVNYSNQDVIYGLAADMGPEAKRLIPDLLNSMHARQERPTAQLAFALGRIAPQDDLVLESLRKAAMDSQASIPFRVAVIWTLAGIGPTAKAVVPDLVKLLDAFPAPRDPRPPSQSDDLLRMLATIVADEGRMQETLFVDNGVRLAGINSTQSPEMLKREPRLMILLALGRFGPTAKAAIPQLEAIVKNEHSDPPARLCSIWALGQIGPGAKATAPTLAAVLKSPVASTLLRERAAVALKNLGPDALQYLLTALEDKTWVTRLLTMKALEEMGAQATAAAPALQTIAMGEDRLLARAALLALARINGSAASDVQTGR